MVPFQAHPLSPNNTRKTAIPDHEFDISSKKRKWDDKALPADHHDHQTLDKKTKSIFDIELHLETPLPLEWERCLDIQSGQIHFYNTRTNKRTSGDPRISPDPPGPGHMSLDLELNLPCDSQRKNLSHNLTTPYHLTDLSIDINHQQQKKTKSGNIARIPSWLAFEGGDDDQLQQQKEMVATACMKCHMLVMLCKSSPTCPNCKFTHPPDQTPPKLFKQRLSLLC
ncbi:hypothetical protein LWI29_027856 [Acer saccharum]|uniref:WW domain-containing protein n=1 Tax=Acer saccharum TaxID=4024 RepID=A0AA39VEE9_ACESA|nr:hypothetical protein LWI29_027856 [Acer saccharum]KAK1555864.1 hypothetical protein Q3G72_032502 [Acer saccharum]